MPRDIKIRINQKQFESSIDDVDNQKEAASKTTPKKTKRSKSKLFKKFVDKVNRKQIKRKPVKTNPKKMKGTLLAKRNKRIAIREGALRSVSIIIRYKKVTTGKIKRYEINPISWRYRKLKSGYRKVLFALDKKANKQIKMFVLRNIQNVGLTDKKFKSKYPIEIK
jgi:predicted DNA binding protein